MNNVIPFPSGNSKLLPDGTLLEFEEELDGAVLLLIWESEAREGGYMIECGSRAIAWRLSRQVEQVVNEFAERSVPAPG